MMSLSPIAKFVGCVLSTVIVFASTYFIMKKGNQKANHKDEKVVFPITPLSFAKQCIDVVYLGALIVMVGSFSSRFTEKAFLFDAGFLAFLAIVSFGPYFVERKHSFIRFTKEEIVVRLRTFCCNVNAEVNLEDVLAVNMKQSGAVGLNKQKIEFVLKDGRNISFPKAALYYFKGWDVVVRRLEEISKSSA